MAEMDLFPEIARIEGDIIIKRNLVEDVLGRLEAINSAAMAIHVVIGRPYSTTVVLGELASSLLGSWSGLEANSKNIALSAGRRGLGELFQSCRDANSEKKQLVIFREPIFSLRNDGSKTLVANFFIDIWSTPNYPVLAGIAATLSSSCIIFLETKIMSKHLKWFTNMLSVSLKMNNGPRKLQNVFFIIKGGTTDKKLPLAKPLFLEEKADFSNLTCNAKEEEDRRQSILEIMGDKTNAYLLPEKSEESSPALRPFMRQIFRSILDNDLVRLNGHGTPMTTGGDILEELTNIPSLEELNDFSDSPLLDELLRENSESHEEVESSKSGNTSENETDDDEETAEKETSHGASVVEPHTKDNSGEFGYQAKTSTPFSLSTTSIGAFNSRSPISLAEFKSQMKSDDNAQKCKMEATIPDVKIVSKFAQAADHSMDNLNVKELLRQIFYEEGPTHLLKIEPVTSLAPLNDYNIRFLETAQEERTTSQKNYALRQSIIYSDDEYRKELTKCIQDQFLKSHISPAKNIFATAVSQVKSSRPNTCADIHSALQQQLVIAMKIVISYQEDFAKLIKSKGYFQSDEDFNTASDECFIVAKRKIQGLSREFLSCVTLKVENLNGQYMHLNSQIKENQIENLSELEQFVEREFRSQFNEFNCTGSNIVDSYFSKIQSSISKLYVQEPPCFGEAFKRLREKLMKIQIDEMSSRRNHSTADASNGSMEAKTQKNNADSKITSNGRCRNRAPPVEYVFSHKSGAAAKDPDSPHKPSMQIRSQSKSSPNKKFACIIFDWDSLVAFTEEANGERKDLYGPAPNQIEISETEIRIGNECKTKSPVRVRAFANFFLELNSYSSFPQNMVDNIALILLKINKSICKGLGQQPSTLLLVLPTFGCPHLAKLFLSAVTTTELNITVIDKSVCLLLNEMSSVKGSRDVAVINDFYDQKYCTLSLYRLNGLSYVEAILVIHAWEQSSYILKWPTNAHVVITNDKRCSKVKNKIEKVIIILDSKSNTSIVKDIKGYFSKADVVVDKNAAKSNATGAINLANGDRKELGLLIKYCSLVNKINKMSDSECKHKEFHEYRLDKNSVQDRFKADQTAVSKAKDHFNGIMFVKLEQCGDEPGREKITEGIRQLDGAITLTKIHQIMDEFANFHE